MKVLHVIASMETGGAQKLIKDLLPELKKEGIEIELLVYRKSNSLFEQEIEQNSKIKIYSLNCKNIYNPFIAIRLIPYIRKFDIIHGHLFPTLYYLAVANFLIKKPLVYTEHSNNNGRRSNKWLKIVEKFIYQRYKCIVSISDKVQDSLQQWIGAEKNKLRLEIVYNGIKVKEYQGISPSVSLENFWGRRGIPILMISRFTPAKDHATVMRAIPLVKNTDVFVAFAGEGSSMQEHIALAEAWGIKDRCVFLGNRSDIPQLVANCRIGVQSSNWEGFGLTALEFMAGGKPIITTCVDGLMEIVKGYGLTFNVGDEQQLASHINMLMENEACYEQIAKQCSLRANEFAISCTAKGYRDVYKKVLNFL